MYSNLSENLLGDVFLKIFELENSIDWVINPDIKCVLLKIEWLYFSKALPAKLGLLHSPDGFHVSSNMHAYLTVR
jgi:hypothetical protein